MRIRVSFERLTMSESPPANVAGIRHFARVNSLMTTEVVALAECAFADLACQLIDLFIDC
jgi:hypothetical protein